jgi:hypothetical protein
MKDAITQPLIGRIMYHISSQPSSKKRARQWEENNEATSLDETSIFRRGFIFLSEEDEQQRQEYSLIVPYQSLRIASHAASSGKLVQISQYSLLRYRNDWGEVLFSSGGVKNLKERTSAMEQREEDGRLVIEVFIDGISLATSSWNADEEEKEEEIQSPVLTLETLAQNEYQQLTKGKKKKSQDKQPIHVTGVVDAISPILVNDLQQEPFSIMELYQSPMTEEERTRTAVVIIRGEKALTVHPAIHPGQTITLLSVVHRKWKVPDEFRKRASNEKQCNQTSLFERLCYRVPGRVILVTEASKIKWNDGTSLKPNLSLPSTVESLTSIRGVVKSVHYHCVESRSGKADRILHFVTIKPLTVPSETGSESTSNELKLACIYLPKYAIPPTVSLGLQAESIIRAINIHFISPPIGVEAKCPFKHQVSNDYLCYVACLRSTISIERCAGESNRRNRSSNIWFVPSRNKPFLLVPDRRISDICADTCHSKSSAQLLAEDRLRCELQSNPRLAHDISSKAWSTLLGYHYHIVDDYGQPVANCEHMRCNCPTRKTKIMPVENESTSGRKTIRDPYSEFFDHSLCDSHDDWIECGSSSSSFSYFNHLLQSKSETTPIVIDTENLRNACTQHFIQRIGSLCRRSNQSKAVELQAGWTNSFCFGGLKFLQVLNDYLMQSDKDPMTWCEKDSIHVYTGGQIENTTDASLLHNDACVIPVCEIKSREEDDCRSGIKSAQTDDRSLFRWVHIDSINLSCVCVGPCTKKKLTSVHTVYHHVFLPSACSESVSGNTFVFLVDNLVFIGSVYIIAKSILPNTIIHRCKSEPKLEKSDTTGNDVQMMESPDSKLGIGCCLEQVASHQLEIGVPSIIIGRLMRHRFKFRKVKSAQKAGEVETKLEKCYEGWSVTLSHINHSREHAFDSTSTLQNIEVTISIPFSCATVDSNGSNSAISLDALKCGLRELFRSRNATNSGARISSDQETMCLAWWRASGCCQTLPILSGGLDSPPVYVEIPFSARSFAKLGYQQFRCHFSALKAYHVVQSHVHSTPIPKDKSKFLPGMLNRHLHRTTPSVPSPLNYIKPGCGISTVSLADLHWDICNAIRNEDSSFLKPSLLRRIHDVRIVGISFCRARVECQQCFQALVEKCGNAELTESIRTEGLPNLLCPSGCLQSQASVKWECSAIVDDGTGQAKLYAEREAALLLLSNDLDVATVERGAWYCEEGVFFQPSLPPTSSLAQSIKTASANARKHIPSSKQKCNLGEELASTYSLLPDNAKAEYLLQQHCRHWSHRHGQRRLDLFCRCKPLSVDLSLNGTEINVAKAMVAHVGLEFGMTATTTLPPLKLTLEDACVCSEERAEDKLIGWELLKA